MAKKDSKYCSCLYYSASALGRAMTKMAEEEFAVTGLAPSHALLLMSVNEKPGIQPSELSCIMGLTPSTVTRLVEKLEGKGLVTRQSSGRMTEVHPTPMSQQLEKGIKEAWANLYTRYTDLLGKRNAKQLTENIYDAVTKLEG